MALQAVNPTPRVGAEIDIDQADLLSGRYASDIRDLLELRGVVYTRGRALAALDGGVIETASGQPLEKRLARIHADVCALIAEHQPDALAIEELYFGANARSAFAVPVRFTSIWSCQSASSISSSGLNAWMPALANRMSSPPNMCSTWSAACRSAPRSRWSTRGSLRTAPRLRLRQRGDSAVYTTASTTISTSVSPSSVTARHARMGGLLRSAHSSQARFISGFRAMSAM